MTKARMATLVTRTSARLFSSLCAILALGACITVNVNFPESAVQRAADDFVRDLYKDDTKAAPAPPSKGTKPKTSLYDALVPSAWAQEINTSTPDAIKIKKRMSERVGKISQWKSKGVLGETVDGMLVVKDPKSLVAGDRKEVEALVKAENGDREDLYEEIQEANSITDRKQAKIRKFFSAAFREHSPPGTWVEAESGDWSKK